MLWVEVKVSEHGAGRYSVWLHATEANTLLGFLAPERDEDGNTRYRILVERDYDPVAGFREAVDLLVEYQLGDVASLVPVDVTAEAEREVNSGYLR